MVQTQFHWTGSTQTHFQPDFNQLLPPSAKVPVGRLCTSRLSVHCSARSPDKTLQADYSPLRRAVSAADLQQVIVVLQLKVRENQGNGVSWLSQHGPGAVSVVVVLGRVIGSGDHPTLAPQCSTTPIICCREYRTETVVLAKEGNINKDKH